MLEPSATWKGKSLPRKSWLRVLRTAPSTKLLFGRISGPSTASRGAASWIASVRATRARLSPSQESSSARKTPAIFGRTSRASSVRCNPAACSSKTSTRISALDSAKSQSSYDAWVIRARQQSLARRKSAPLTSESDCSSWPTARAEDSESCGNHSGSTDSLTGASRNWKTPHGFQNTDRFGKTAGGGGEFAKQAMGWQTPATDSFRSRGGDRKDEPGLDQQARKWPTPKVPTGGAEVRASRKQRGSGGEDLAASATVWPTPRSNDYKSGVTGNIKKKNARPLCEVACQSSLPAPPTSTPGASSSPSTRRLNPRFVEMLMGLPVAWTGLEPVATASFRWWLHTHFERLQTLLNNR